MLLDATAETPSVYPEPSELSRQMSGHCKRHQLIITNDLCAVLWSIAESEKLEPDFLLLSIFQELLRRYTGQSDLLVLLYREASADRRCVLAGTPSVREYVRQIQVATLPDTALRLDDISLEGGFSFLYGQGMPKTTPGTRDARIHCLFSYKDGVLNGALEYDPQIWSPSIIEHLSVAYVNMLDSALANLDARLDQLEVLSDLDIRTFDEWNRTHRPVPELCVIDLFEQRAAETPEGSALSFEGTTLTYRQLLNETNALAGHLKSLGVAPGVKVGICIERSKEMVVALLAVFQAGAAYVPLDPAFPVDRVKFMQEDAQPVVIITQSHLQGKFEFTATQVVCTDTLNLKIGTEPAIRVIPRAKSTLDDLAYVLYTSGSTGKPKGVKISNRALTNLLTTVAADLPLEKGDNFLATSSISFDISAFEIFAPLISGAHLTIVPRSVTMNGELLAEAIRTNKSSVLQSTPSGWRILLEAGWEGQPGLKMLTAGEPLDRTLADRLLDRGANLWNLYGPTEATIYATGKRITKQESKITIGFPLANYTAYVLDGNRKRLPVGALGELYLGGVGIANGYLNRAELTSEKFIPDPFGGNPTAVLYQTGDLARFLASGEIELLGRADNQVKLRGYRIELGEIEALLDSHPAVRKSVVKVISVSEGDERLAAYFVGRHPRPVAEAELRDFTMRSLPWYMCPALFVQVDSFALAPTGKIDRKALPSIPAAYRLSHRTPDPAEQESELESTVLSCWRSVLKIPDLALDDDFFEAGGHSLLAARMFAHLDSILGCKLPVSWLLEAPTSRRFAKLISSLKISEAGTIVSMQPEGSRPPLYLIHHLLGDVLIYRTVANCFRPDRPVYGIQPPADLLKRPRPYNLSELASEYVGEILKQQSEGPFHLAGFSSGSVMAFEMARQLTAMGHKVGLLALIDGDVQAPGKPMSKLATYYKICVRKLAKIVFKMRDELNEGPRQFVAKRVKYVWLLWRIRHLENSGYEGDLKVTVDQALLLAERAFVPKPYSGSSLLIRFHDEAWSFGPDPFMGWQTLIEGGIKIVDFPGGHMTGMNPANAPMLADALRQQMESLEAAWESDLKSDKTALSA